MKFVFKYLGIDGGDIVLVLLGMILMVFKKLLVVINVNSLGIILGGIYVVGVIFGGIKVLSQGISIVFGNVVIFMLLFGVEIVDIIDCKAIVLIMFDFSVV